MSLDRHHKTMLLLGCLSLPFDSATVTMIIQFITSAIGKIYKLRTERLHELGAPWPGGRGRTCCIYIQGVCV